MRTHIVCVALLLLSSLSHSQILEHFDASHVPWHGTDTAWQVSNGRLQSNCLQANSRFWLWTPAGTELPVSWEWWMQLDFNTSSNNYVDVYLLADSSNLLYPELAGYFVRIGGKDDEVCLYKKTPGDTLKKVIDGHNDLTNRRSSVLKLKVTCDEGYNWHLWTDTSGTGRYYVLEGNAPDNGVTEPVCFGIVVRQSTPSFFQKHFFDEVQVTHLVKDTVRPELQSVTVLSANELLLQFSEWVDSTAVLMPLHYQADKTLGSPAYVTQEADGVHLFYETPFPNGDSILLQVTGITDAGGNVMHPKTYSFLYYQPGRYEVVIHEILPDPEPAVGLPLAEFAELRNNSPYPIQLKGWRFAAAGGEAVLPFFELEPDSLLLLCRKDKAAAFADSSRVLALDEFPALGNEADTLTLYDAAGQVMHAVAYEKSWYADAVKEKGGWSLEMIAPAAPCDGSTNWKAATAVSGSTPGRPNSVTAITTGSTFPDLLRVYVSDSTAVSLYFSKALDSALADNPAHYRIDPGPAGIAAATVLPPLFNTVQLRLSAPLQKESVYTLSVKEQVKDCKGQPMGIRNSATLALPAVPDSGAVVINEILFDPKPMAPEFVEVYNSSRQAIDLQQLYVAMLDGDGQPGDKVQLSKDNRLLLPGQYIALTRGPDALCRAYTCKAFENVLAVNLPAFPNEEGTLALYNASGQVLDVMHYTAAMQFPLADNAKGVSLERLSFQQATQDANNWHAAAATAGYATPGSVNSQQLNLQELAGEVTVQPAVFSPDNDGMDDMAVIACRLPQAGFVGNITVFDAQGRPVRQLLQNGLLGNHSNIVWDGLGENKQLLPVGIYIIFTEIFDLQGRIKHWKLPVVVARNMK